MATLLLNLNDIHLSLGGKPLLAGASLTVSEGERLCLVGRNGAGKSSFLKIMGGLIEPDGGTRVLRGGTTLRYLAQEPDFGPHHDILSYVTATLSSEDAHHRARLLIAELGLEETAELRRLSGGEQRKVALAQALAAEPEILLLDEPTNHLDLPTIEWLEDKLSGLRSALVLVSHDRRFLERLSRVTLWLDRGQCRRLEQGFSGFEAWRDKVLAEEEAAAHKLARKINEEEHWLRYGVTARRRRNQRRLAALSSLREDLREARRQPDKVTFGAAEGESAGALMLEARDISKAFEGRPTVAHFSLRLTRGARLAIVGPNGAGKTTLLKLLLGELEPDTGIIKRRDDLSSVTVDQKREALSPHLRLAEVLTGGRGDTVMIGDKPRHVVSYMKDYLFPPEAANMPISVLSGGERARLVLARAFTQQVHLLVLDEPTNDLDLETLDLLQELLADHPATILLVSHDRDFIDRVATSVLVAEGEGRFIEYAGGYSDMLAQRGRPVLALGATEKPRAKPKPEQAKSEQDRALATKKAKLTNQEREALRLLPARIEKLTTTRDRLRAILDDPQLFVKDRDSFMRTTALLSETEQRLSEAEDAWLEAELRRGEIEAEA